MENKRRQAVLLTALLVALAAVVLFQWRAGRAEPSSAGQPPAGAGLPRAAASAVPPVADVRLEELIRTAPAPDMSSRNPFRFRPKPPPPPPPEAEPAQPAVPAPQIPAGPPPPPPIPLKFIGLVDAPAQSGRLAVLSDGRNVFHGREGDIIDGRYRIVRIGVESIEISYLDGSGHQVIRLTGG